MEITGLSYYEEECMAIDGTATFKIDQFGLDIVIKDEVVTDKPSNKASLSTTFAITLAMAILTRYQVEFKTPLV